MLNMTVREAINRRYDSIRCNNGTEIFLPDIKMRYEEDQFCPAKIIDGKKVYRTLFWRIGESKNTVVIDHLKAKYCAYSDDDHFFNKYEFFIPEREMNMFISLNGGIDIAASDYWTNYDI